MPLELRVLASGNAMGARIFDVRQVVFVRFGQEVPTRSGSLLNKA